MRSPPFLPFLRGGGGSNRTKNRTKNRGMPRLCHDMCVMTDVPSRGVSAVLTDVQSWPRATRGLSCAAAARGNRGATGRWTVSRSTTRLSQGRAGRSRPAGRHRTVRYFSDLPFTTVDPRPRPDPCRPAVTRSDKRRTDRGPAGTPSSTSCAHCLKQLSRTRPLTARAPRAALVALSRVSRLRVRAAS